MLEKDTTPKGDEQKDLIPRYPDPYKIIENLEMQEDNRYRLVDVSEESGLSPQYILNLIERYELVNPSKSANYGNKEIYEISTEEAITIFKVASLKHRGYVISDIIELIEKESEYIEVSNLVYQAMQEWVETRNSENYRRLVEMISNIPELTEEERNVLVFRHLGYSFVQTASFSNLKSESQTRKTLKEAYAKVGRRFFTLLEIQMLRNN